MPRSDRGQISVLACEGGRNLAGKIVENLNKIIEEENAKRGEKRSLVEVIESKETHFSNDEIKTTLKGSVRGKHVFVVQDIASKMPFDDEIHKPKYTSNDNQMALLSAIAAAAQNDADYISVVSPTLFWDRQDKKFEREAILTSLTASMFKAAGARRVITIDIHAEAVGGIYAALETKFELLYASGPIMEYIKATYGNNLQKSGFCSLALDAGGAGRAMFYASRLKIPFKSAGKERDHSEASKVDSVKMMDVVTGNVLVVEDMIDTAGTLVRGLRSLKGTAWGVQGVYVACTKPYFNGEAAQKLSELYENGNGILKGVIGTNAVTQRLGFLESSPWYHEVDVSPLFARTIYEINTRGSVSKLKE
ncbi:ribose-phosphate diphosphokinase [Candidatus Woesearchaeota archaeon]|nr:ribose-phosphate diphosphokinase [Candidatus Woesearchaeota archaeon]